MPGLSPVAASGGHSSSRCAGLSLSQPLLLRSTGSRRTGSVVVAHGPSCSTTCGIFPDQGSNLCPYIGRQILNHHATREAPFSSLSWTLDTNVRPFFIFSHRLTLPPCLFNRFSLCCLDWIVFYWSIFKFTDSFLCHLYSATEPVVDRMATQRCPLPNPKNLWICGLNSKRDSADAN